MVDTGGPLSFCCCYPSPPAVSLTRLVDDTRTVRESHLDVLYEVSDPDVGGRTFLLLTPTVPNRERSISNTRCPS